MQHRAMLVIAVIVTALAARPARAGDALSALEARILYYTNLERQKAGLTPLRIDPALATAARGHSDEMARLVFFSHQSPTAGRITVLERVALAGCPYGEVGENIACYEGFALDEIGRQVVEDWMNSPGHRANILRPGYTAIGIGVAVTGRKTLITQDFANEGKGAWRPKR